MRLLIEVKSGIPSPLQVVRRILDELNISSSDVSPSMDSSDPELARFISVDVNEQSDVPGLPETIAMLKRADEVKSVTPEPIAEPPGSFGAFGSN